MELVHGDEISSIAFSADSRHLATGSRDKTARVWDVTTGKELARLTHQDIVYSVAFHPDGSRIATGSWPSFAVVWEWRNSRQATLGHDGFVSKVAFSPDGTFLATAASDGTVRIWDAARLVEVARAIHADAVDAIAFAPDGRRIAAGSRDGKVGVWQTRGGTQLTRLARQDSEYPVTLNLNGRYVAAFDPNGRRLLTASGNRALGWNIENGQKTWSLEHQSRVISVALNDRGDRAATGSEADEWARVWEVPASKLVARLSHQGPVLALAFSADGRYLATGGADRTVRVWDLERNTAEIARFQHDARVLAVAFSADGQRLISGGDDKTARVWNVKDRKLIARLTHPQSVRNVALRGDGIRAATVCLNDNNVRMWDVGAEREMWRRNHQGADSVVFSTDGGLVAIGSLPPAGTTRVWKSETGDEIIQLEEGGPVAAVHFDAAGRELVIASGELFTDAGISDVRIRRYPVNAQALIDDICARLPRSLTQDEWEQYLPLVPRRETCETQR